MDELRSFLAAIVDSSDDAIIGLTPYGRIASWNRGAQQIYGYQSLEVLGEPISLLSLPERVDEIRNMLVQLRSGVPLRHLSTIHLHKSGQSISVSLSVSPVIDHLGRNIGASLIVRDTTRQLETEQTLREVEEKYRLLFSTEQDAIVLLDADTGRIFEGNRAALQLYDYPAAAFQQLRLQDLCPDASPARDSAGHSQQRHRRRDGSWFQAEVSSSSFVLKGRTMQAMIVRDISERLQTERLRHALLLAKQIQQQLLPAQTPQIPGYDIYVEARYCQETGGDYYDFFTPENAPRDELNFAVGDVSGHGLAAALLMAMVKGVLQTEAGHGLADSQRLLQSLNRQLADDREGNFLTLFVGRLLTGPHRLQWNSAGHGPVFCYRHQQSRIVELPPSDIPLGIDPLAGFPAPPPFLLSPGDILLIGTDGIWESRNPQGEMFRIERLRQIIASHAAKSASQLHEIVMNKVTEFRQGGEQEDDMTLMVIKASPP